MRENEDFALENFVLGKAYSKIEVAKRGGVTPPANNREWTGIIPCHNAILLFVTLDKSGRESHLKYSDSFDDGGRIFYWDSQNRQDQENKVIHAITHRELPVFLLCRITDKKVKGKTTPFFYVGELLCQDFSGNRPVHCQFMNKDFSSTEEKLRGLYEWQSDKARILTEIEDPNRHTAKGQGFLSDAKKKKAIEDRAMRVAEEFYEAKGWILTDSSSTHPYDFLAQRENDVIRIEVKGTMSGLGSVILTVNEVNNARSDECQTDLFVVHDIQIEKHKDKYESSGGRIFWIENWKPDERDLQPTQFCYNVPKSDGRAEGPIS